MAPENGLHIEEWITRPDVYFDHWAIRCFSEDVELRRRFINTIKARGGTFVLSWVNLAEFTRVSDVAQISLAESFIDEMIPDIFFIEANPFTVIDKENKALAGPPFELPHADTALLHDFAIRRSNNITMFSASGLLAAISNSNLDRSIDSMTNTLIDRIGHLREEMKTNQEFRKNLMLLPTGKPTPRGTLYVLRELGRSFIIDKHIKLTRNLAMDFMHAVVATSYCDYVLLDKHWKEQVNRMKDRLLKGNMSFPVAEVFSKDKGGISSFLLKLSNERTSNMALE